MLLIPALTLVAMSLRQVEVDVLISIGVFKDIYDMNDREMFQEYEKLRKVSLKVKNKYKKYRQQLQKEEWEEENVPEGRLGNRLPQQQ
jgi:hypothetical protein